MDSGNADWMETIRKEVHSLLGALRPQEAKALRARFGIDDANRAVDDDDKELRALVYQLAKLKKKTT